MTDTHSESEGAGDGGATKSVGAMQTSDAARSCRCQAECLSLLAVCVSRRRALCAFLCTRRLLKSVRRYADFSKADGQTAGEEQIELLDGRGVGYRQCAVRLRAERVAWVTWLSELKS